MLTQRGGGDSLQPLNSVPGRAPINRPRHFTGNRNYSGWFLADRHGLCPPGIAFDETVIALKRAKTAAALAGHSSAPRVLVRPQRFLCCSRANLEYVVRTQPEAGLLPSDAEAQG